MTPVFSTIQMNQNKMADYNKKIRADGYNSSRVTILVD